MKIVSSTHRTKEEGSAMLITTIILLVLMVIVATTISISGMQFDLAMLNRNTSNTYYLAKSALEKQVDTMNKAMESQLTKIIKEMNSSTDANKNFITQLVGENANIVHDTSNKKIMVNNNKLREILCDELYTYLKSSYKTKPDIPGADGKDPITYTVQSDRAASGYVTEIAITITDEKIGGGTYDKTDPKFRVIATATTKNGSEIYDRQTVEGLIEVTLPTTINNEIHERYEFAKEASGETIIPELLKSPLISYSDVVVSGAGELNITGDMYVGGKVNISNFGTADAPQYPEADQNGGVIVLNGGKLNVTGNLYTTRNVLATAGWGGTYSGGGQIEVSKDLVAYTLGIVDDFYKNSANQSPFASDKQVSGAKINVSGNVMVDNDVMIDRWVNGGKINVEQSIFGVNGSATGTDPNESSGVFAQGPGSQVIAKRMFVAGQPYVTLAEGKKPLKLWESIGEPFDGVASFEGYATYDEQDSNKNYLSTDSPFYSLIAGNKIKTNFSTSYAIAKVSGIDTSTGTDAQKVGANCASTLTNESNAFNFFFQGGSLTKFDDATDSTDAAAVETIIKTNLDKYYKGEAVGTAKKIADGAPDYYKGVRGYMTVMRSVLYNKFVSGAPVTETFATVIGTMPTTNTWSYATPIEVVNPTATTGETVDISNFYVDEGSGTYAAYPSIIVNTSSNPLIIKAGTAGRNTFNGVIISKGPIELKAGITINGTVIAGGPETMPDPKTGDRKAIFAGDHAGIIVEEGKVNITSDSGAILKVVAKDHALYRSILDMLYMTDYTKSVLTQVMSKQSPYTKKLLKYTKASVLEVSTEGIEVAIKSLKKTQ